MVSGEEIIDPLLGEEGQSAAFACDDVSVEVEHSDFVLGGLLLVLEDELLNVLAALEQLFPVLNLEHRLSPVIPSLARNDAHWSQGLWVDLHLMSDGLAAELPVCLGSRKCRNDSSII